MNILELKEPYKSMAIKNRKVQRNDENINLSGVTICSGFTWGKTEEGDNFWRQIDKYGVYPEITEEVKSYHPDIFPKSKGLPEEFGIKTEGVNPKEVIDFLVENGYENTYQYRGIENAIYGKFESDKSKIIQCRERREVKGIKTFTLKEAKEMVEIKQEEVKKVIGYRSPIDLFSGNIKKDTVFSSIDGINYLPKDVLGADNWNLPKEIVETWEPCYGQEEFKAGDYIVITNSVNRHFEKDSVLQLSKGVNGNYIEVKVDSLGNKHNGIGAKSGETDLSYTMFRKATEAEVKVYKESKEQKTIKVGSNNKEIVVKKSGDLFVESTYVNVGKIKALIEDYTVRPYVKSVGGKWDVSVQKDIRFLKIGCLVINLNELQLIVDTVKDLQK